MWKKLKAALTGSNRAEFRAELTRLLNLEEAFDLKALVALYGLSDIQTPIEVERVTIEALSSEWTRKAGRRSLNLDQEADRLAKLGLGRNFTRRILSGFGQTHLSKVTSELLSDGIVEPAEDALLEAEASALGLPVPQSHEIDEAREIWRATNEPLPEFNAPILLKRGEICHQAQEANAYEDRTRTMRINYSGPSARVRIMKGVYYNVGSMRVQSQKEEYSHSLGSGVLCVTNSRLIFISPSKTITIPLGKILQYVTYSDGIKIFKDTGKPITFELPKVDRPDVIRLVRVIEECR